MLVWLEKQQQLLGTSYKMPNFDYEVKYSANINDELKVEVKDELCKRYMARGVKNVKDRTITRLDARKTY